MFASHHEGEDYARYPDPPHSAASFESATTSPMEMNGIYTIPSTVAFEPTMYAETSHYVLGGNTSPTLYPEDSELRIPSSSLSAASAASSAAASPQSNPGQHSVPSPEWATSGLVQPTIVSNDFIAHHPDFTGFHAQHVEEMNFDFAPAAKGYVDPSLINQEMGGLPMPAPHYDYHYHHQQPQQPFPTSPSVASSPQLKMLRTNSSSPTYFANPQMHPTNYAPSPYVDTSGRRPSMSSFISPASGEYHSGDETKIKQRCTYPDCGKVFKDLKAHMLTHQNERPEKCPIQTCEYHTKGFARKYDKNRHTLTHYKGTMVCGFCPGSGSATEKSFNRADVFKRHLTAVHGVEQTPPNSRKKSSMTITTTKKLSGYASDATGKCSTCSQTFSNAQDFYEHLDDCVLRIVQQEDPSEAINVQCLTEVENDKDVKETLEKNNLPLTTQVTSDNDDANDSDMADSDDDSSSVKLSGGVSKKKGGNPANGVQKSRGMTHSRGGVPMTMKSKNRKNRDKRYPVSWGYDPSNMTLKHRVMTCFDGQRRLAKDDMALSTAHEVRLQLSDPKAYTTDLDVQTLRRAEGFHSATEEERGIWISDDPTEAQYRQMSEHAAMMAASN